MKKRFAPRPLLVLILAATGLTACIHRDAGSEAGATPVYRPQDLEEATASVGRHMDLQGRVATLENQMTVMRVELSRLSGAAQRIEARQLQSGVTPEPLSAMASALDHKPAARKPAPAKPAAPKAQDVAEGTEPPTPPAPAAETPAAPPSAAQTAAEAQSNTESPEPLHAEPPPNTDSSSSSTGFGLQLAAYGSAEQASAAWEKLQKEGGTLLADLFPKREEIESGGRTLYRLKAGPLPDAATAKARCDELKAQGLQCLVSAFSGDWP